MNRGNSSGRKRERPDEQDDSGEIQQHSSVGVPRGATANSTSGIPGPQYGMF
jgi:hypothetical protein